MVLKIFLDHERRDVGIIDETLVFNFVFDVFKIGFLFELKLLLSALIYLKVPINTEH